MAILNVLDQMEERNAELQKSIQDKLEKGLPLTDSEI